MAVRIEFTNPDRTRATVTLGRWWWKRIADVERLPYTQDRSSGWYYAGSSVRVGEDEIAGKRENWTVWERRLDEASKGARDESFWRRPMDLPAARLLPRGPATARSHGP